MDDLVKRLRDEHLPMTRSEAADRIEALELALTQSRAETAAAHERAAAEMDLAAHIMSHHGTTLEEKTYQNAAKDIRALATPDQSAALDAVRAEARAQGMREAAEIAKSWKDCGHDFDIEDEILAAIKGAKA